MFNTPVVLIAYKRPELTRRCLDRILEQSPRHLFVILDGPKREADRKPCDQVLALFDRLPSSVSIDMLRSDVNLGCFKRVSSGLDHVFSKVERAVILEDDCLPHSTFFRYASELLDHYARVENVGVISGNCFLFGNRPVKESYYFSAFNHLWGWATWKRAWAKFDPHMAGWPEKRDSGWLQSFWPDNPRAVRFWTDCFDRTYAGEIDSWGYRWTYACWAHGLLTAIPRLNAVTNAGFGSDSTHTKHAWDLAADMRAYPIDFPLRHPEPPPSRQTSLDAYVQTLMYTPSLKTRFYRYWLKFFKNG